MKKLISTCLCALLASPALAIPLRIADSTRIATSTTINGKLMVAGQETDAYAIASDEKLSISFELTMSQAEISNSGLRNRLYMAAMHDGQWYAKNTDQQWVPWNGKFATLPYFAYKNDSVIETLQVIDNRQLPVGDYQVYIGHGIENMHSGIVYNSQAFNFIVYDKDAEGLQRLSSNQSLEQYLKQAISTNSDYESYLIDGQEPVSFLGVDSYTLISNNDPYYESLITPLTNLIRDEVDQGGQEQQGIAGLFLLDLDEDGYSDSESLTLTYSSMQEAIYSADSVPRFDINLQESWFNSEMFHYRQAESAQQSLIIVSSDVSETEYLDDDFNSIYSIELYIGDESALSVPLIDENRVFKNPYIEEQHTNIDINDATNPDDIQSIYRFKLDGKRVNSYQSDNVLYVITRHSPYIKGFIHYVNDETGEFNKLYDDLLHNTPLQKLLPSISLNDRPAQPLVNGENCYIPAYADLTQKKDVITTITAFPLDNPEAFYSTCLLSSVDAIHATKDSIYLFKQPESGLNTVVKFAYQNSGLVYKGATTLKGYGYDSFSNIQKHHYLDEDNDILRIFTFDKYSETGTSSLSLIKPVDGKKKLEQASFITLPKLYTMDSHLIQFLGPRLVLFERELVTQSAKGLDLNTEVYRAKPLHIIDLSDPYHPEKLGEIQTNGYLFSLLPINENYLLGIGKDTGAPVLDQSGQALYSHYRGLKLSLYDLTDKNRLGEVTSISMGQRGTESALFFNAKSYAFTPETANQPARFALPIALAETLGSVFDIPRKNIPLSTYTEYLSTLESGTQALSENEFYWAEYQVNLDLRTFNWTETGAYVFDIHTQADMPQISLAGKLLRPSGEAYTDFSREDMTEWDDRILLNETGLYYRHEIENYYYTIYPIENYYSPLADLQ